MEPIDSRNFACQGNDIINQWFLYNYLVFLAIQLVILIFLILRFRIIGKMLKSKQIYKIHVVILLWSIAFLLDYSIDMINFWQGKNNNNLNQKLWLYYVPALIASIDSTSAMFLQTIFIIIPYYWILNILYELDPYINEKKYKNIRRLQKIINGYIYLSRIIFILAVISLLIVAFCQINWCLRIFKIITFGIIIEAFLCSVYLLFTYLFLRNIKQSLHIRKKLLFECLSLIIVCLLRFTLDIIIFGIQNLDRKGFQQECDNTFSSCCITYKTPILYYVLMNLSIILTHFVPGILALYIYKPVKTNAFDNSLISNQDVQNNQENLQIS